MTGPNVTFDAGNSNAKKITGDKDTAAVAVTNNLALTSVKASGSLGKGTISGSGVSGTAVAQTAAFPDQYGTVQGLESIYEYMKSIADFFFDKDAPANKAKGIDTVRDADLPVMTSSTPKVMVINGDCVLSGSHHGVLVVTGELTLNGGFSFEGLILVIGEGRVVRNGGGMA